MHRHRHIIGIAGSVILMVGLFLPVFNMPGRGILTYFQYGREIGTILLLFSLIGLILAIRGDFALLGVPGLFSLALLMLTFLNFQEGVAVARAGLEYDILGSEFPGVMHDGLAAVRLQWGWIVLLLGSALQVAASGIRTR